MVCTMYLVCNGRHQILVQHMDFGMYQYVLICSGMYEHVNDCIGQLVPNCTLIHF